MSLTISSPAFQPNGPIPTTHTCDGADTPPPLEWSGVPPEANSLVLIVDDPDAPDPKAPKRTFVHWVLYDLPPATQGLTAGSPLPLEAREGVNDSGGRGYTGPCPPIGRHRYFFKLYALDIALGDLGAVTKFDLEPAMRGHILAQAEVIGTYARK